MSDDIVDDFDDVVDDNAGVGDNCEQEKVF